MTVAQQRPPGRRLSPGRLSRRRFAALAGAAAAAPFVLPFAARAATTWRLAGAYPEGNYQTLTTQFFAEDLANATGGSHAVEVYANGSLYAHDAIADAVAGGQVELGEIQLAWLGPRLPVAEVDAVPFLATTYEEALRLWQASRVVFQRAFAGVGLVPLYAVPWPPVGLASRVPLNGIADLAGRRFYANNAITRRFAELVGAKPVEVEPNRVVEAFEAGAFDALFAPVVEGIARSAPSQPLTFYDVGAWLPKNAVVMAKSVYEPLSTQTQEQLIAVAEAAEQRGWAASRLEYQNRLTTLEGYGVAVIPPGEALVGELREVGMTLAREWLTRAGFYGEDVLRGYRNT